MLVTINLALKYPKTSLYWEDKSVIFSEQTIFPSHSYGRGRAGMRKGAEPGCAAQAACRFNCTELLPLVMSARFKPPYTTNRSKSSKAHQHVLSSNSFRLLTRLKKIMCFCVLPGFSPQNQKQFRNVFTPEWNKEFGSSQQRLFLQNLHFFVSLRLDILLFLPFTSC